MSSRSLRPLAICIAAACAAPPPAPAPGDREAREAALEAEIEAARDAPEPEPEAAPVPTTTEWGEPRFGIANVESIEIAPSQAGAPAAAIARGAHPDACTGIHDATLVRRGNTFQFAVSTLRPPGVCAADRTPFTRVLPLDLAGLPAGTYSVIVNGASAAITVGADGSTSPP
jgi:hypothetical protein